MNLNFTDIGKTSLQTWCKECKAKIKHDYIRRPEIKKRNAEQALKRSRMYGVKPMSENRECSGKNHRLWM